MNAHTTAQTVTALVGAHTSAAARTALTRPTDTNETFMPRRTATDRRTDRRRERRSWQHEVSEYVALHR